MDVIGDVVCECDEMLICVVIVMFVDDVFFWVIDYVD